MLYRYYPSKERRHEDIPMLQSMSNKYPFLSLYAVLMRINGHNVKYRDDKLICVGRLATLPDKLYDLTPIFGSMSAEVIACGGSVCFGRFISSRRQARVCGQASRDG
jgi:hypothetical protein